MFTALILFDVRAGWEVIAPAAGALAVAGILLSVAIISLGRWLWSRWRSDLQDRAILPRRYLRIVAGIWMLIGLGAFVTLSLLDSRPRRGSSEASATATLRTLTTSMITYESTYHRGFPEALDMLGPPAPGKQSTAGHADLVDPVLSGTSAGGTPHSFTKNGYKFRYKPGPGPPGKITTYTITADPLERGKDGIRSFFTDQTAVVRANTTTVATASDSPI